MLRVYSILQLEPLWLKSKPQCELILQDEEAIAPTQVIQETEVLVEEPISYQQEVVEPAYQVVEQEVVHVVHKTNTSTEETSVQVIELEVDESDNNKHEKGNNSSSSSSSESSSEEEEEVLEEKEKVAQTNGKEDLTPITTKDLTSITEEPNDSSNISSSSSSPETPSSAQSPRPRMRLRKDSKFNERRKSMTNKLKRAFSSASSSSSKRNSIIST